MNENISEIQNHSDSAADLMVYLSQKARLHNYYKCYAPIDRIVAIRDTRSLYLGTPNGWNDVTDRDGIHEEGSFKFAKCFSFSKDENVAMWMLYGGIHAYGGMIDFTKNAMNSILNDTQSIEIGYFSDDSKFHCVRTVSKGEFEISLTDVVYYTRNGKKGTYSLSRSEEKAFDVMPEVVEQLKDNKKIFAWKHENECRLIIKLDRSMVPNKCNTARIDLEGLSIGTSYQRMYYAPNYPGGNTFGLQPSNLWGTVDWKLCDYKDCKYRQQEEKNK